MEGRLGRASSRYGPTATVFNGPVRKWKKRWVYVARSSPSAVSYDHTAQSNGQNTLLLRRWTPTTLAGDDAGAPPDERPRRKFRYTPIAVLEEQRKVSGQSIEDEVKPVKSDRSPARPASVSRETDDDPKKEIMKSESNSSDFDLGIDLKGDDDDDDNDNDNDRDAAGENKEIQTETASG